MQLKQRNSNRVPAGWPAHLHPYSASPHRPRVVSGVDLHPYDWTASRVKSWVALRGGRYLGLIAVSPGGACQAFHQGSRTAVASTLERAVAHLVLR
jgi:hypothetical protein